MTDKEHRFIAVKDLLSLSSEEFVRFLPDLIVWHGFCRDLAGGVEGVEIGPLVWLDDGRAGEFHSFEMTIKETGEKFITPGPAYSERGSP